MNKVCCHTETPKTAVFHNASEIGEYTCPMHPEVVSNKPGACPICGMSLERTSITLDDKDDDEYHDMLKKFWLSAILALPVAVLAMGQHFLPIDHSISWILQFLFSTPVVLYAGYPFFVRGYQSIKNLSPNMFTLISLGIGIAYLYSVFTALAPEALIMKYSLGVYFEAAAIITSLVLLGQVIELKARSKTSSAIKELLTLSPIYASIIKEDGSEHQVPISDIAVGDILRVRPGEKIPLDGILTDGNSYVDESMITGESMPVSKDINAKLIGGTLNGDGSFLMRVEKIGSDTMLMQIIHMVLAAQRTKAPIQKLADVISYYFVPAVMLTAIITALAWYYFSVDQKIANALLNSIAVLIIACPCAIGLATPMSIMVATGLAAKHGVLVKNAASLELLGQIDVLVVDKTGTLTEGKPKLLKTIASHNFTEEDVLHLAASIDTLSEHPLAHAITKAAAEQNLKPINISDFKYIKGQGISAKIKGKLAHLGNVALMTSQGIDCTSVEKEALHHQDSSETVVYLAVEGAIAGLLCIADDIKTTTQDAIDIIKAHGIEVVMLTGDNEYTARNIAKTLGITHYKAQTMPSDKLNYIKQLQSDGKKVAMAGDGINDAPALVQADVAIAMGTGSDVAIESAGITLVKGDLIGIVRALNISRSTVRNIKQNLFLAFAYNTAAIPIAAGLLYPFFGISLSPIIASAAMSLSSASVIINALRLNRIELK